MNNINNEIKIARYLGISRLKDMNVDTYMYSCHCGSIFNVVQGLMGKVVSCPDCKLKVKLEKNE